MGVALRIPHDSRSRALARRAAKEKRIVTIDMLGDEFLETVQMGDPIAIHEDGTVEIG